MRQNTLQTYNWDFNLANGYTIKEKYNDLCDKIHILCFGCKPAVVVANEAICGCLNDFDRGHFCPKYETLEDGRLFIGTIHSDKCVVHIFQQNDLSDEVLVYVNEQPRMVKIYNGVL